MSVSSQSSPAVPRHIAIIMDGNGRWAEQRGLPRSEGHRQGIEAVRRVAQAMRDLEVPVITLFAFSAENWRRPLAEVSTLMGQLEFAVQRHIREMLEKRIHLTFVGNIDGLPRHLQRLLRETSELTAPGSRNTLVMALNYGSRQEVVAATRAYAEAVAAGREDAADLDWERYRRYLWTADWEDPDLLVRTSGESRISNFLLLQCAYAELYFTPTLWPEFGKEDLRAAIEEYGRRERRYGGTGQAPAGRASNSRQAVRTPATIV